MVLSRESQIPLNQGPEGTSMVLGVYGFKDYTLPHHKRIVDTCMKFI